MDLVKRMGFVVLYALCLFMVFQADAMQIKTYGKPSKGFFNGFQDPSQPRGKGLEFKRADKENKPSTKRKAEDTPESSPVKRQKRFALAEIQNRVTSADDYELPVVMVTPESEAREQKCRIWNAYKTECKANGDYYQVLENFYQADKQATLAKKIQEEKDRKCEQDRLAVIAASKQARAERVARKEAREKEKALHPETARKYNSRYAQNLMAAGASRQDWTTGLYIEIAEGNYEAAIPYFINGRERFLDNPNIQALRVIGTQGNIQYEPQVVYEQLHRDVTKIGPHFPVKNLDECAKYFAEKAKNKSYIDYVDSLNK